MYLLFSKGYTYIPYTLLRVLLIVRLPLHKRGHPERKKRLENINACALKVL